MILPVQISLRFRIYLGTIVMLFLLGDLKLFMQFDTV